MLAERYDEPQARELPHSVEAEQSVLGALMLVNESLPEVAGWLESGHFYRHDHRAIYAAITELANAEKPFDAVTVGDWLAGSEVDYGYVVEITANTGSAANIRAYAEIVKEHANRRALVEVGIALTNAALDPAGKSADEIAGEAGRELSAMETAKRGGCVLNARQVGKVWADDFQRRYENGGQIQGLCLPWAEFNRRSGGLNPGDLVIVAGRPGMGKSAFAINAATSVAMRGKRALMFSLEMSAAQIFNRALSSITDVPLAWLKAPDAEHGEFWPRVTAGTAKLRDSGLLIDDTAGLAWPQIEARAQREAMRGKLDMIVVDHLHLIPLPGKTRETVEIGHITAGAKKLGKRHGCPVVLLSQLNRSLEARQNKRPVMSDLRESGNIEQDADLIVFLYRDDYYAEMEGRGSQAPGIVELHIAKHREGEPGRVLANAALAYGRIDDREDQGFEISLGAKSAKSSGLK